MNPILSTDNYSNKTSKISNSLSEAVVLRTVPNMRGKNPRASVCPTDSHPGKYITTPIDPSENRTKLILFWNRPPDWWHTADSCEYKDCVITDDKCDFPRSDAVLYHTPYLSVKYVPKRIPGQIFVYMSLEPPFRMFRNYKNKMWHNVFNWTWSYRRDADIFQPYGEFILLDHRENNNKQLNISQIIDSKTKFAAWFVSICKSESKRDKYVKTLQKYVNIDIYGKCGPLNCSKKEQEKCTNMLNRDYKFQLCFENSLCRDYVSEKELHVFDRFIIPVTRGSPQSYMYKPPHSYIDTSKFSSVKRLADYLKEVAKDKTRYRDYFKWRKHYRMKVNWQRGLCEFCKRLHNVDKYRRLYQDIHSWERQIGNKAACNTNPKDFY